MMINTFISFSLINNYKVLAVLGSNCFCEQFSLLHDSMIVLFFSALTFVHVAVKDRM